MVAVVRSVPGQLVNKECEAPNESGSLTRRNSEYGFSIDDEKLLRMLCHHCSIFLRQCVPPARARVPPPRRAHRTGTARATEADRRLNRLLCSRARSLETSD